MVKVSKSYLKYFKRNDFLENKKIQKNDFFAIFHEIQGGGVVATPGPCPTAFPL